MACADMQIDAWQAWRVHHVGTDCAHGGRAFQMGSAHTARGSISQLLGLWPRASASPQRPSFLCFFGGVALQPQLKHLISSLMFWTFCWISWWEWFEKDLSSRQLQRGWWLPFYFLLLFSFCILSFPLSSFSFSFFPLPALFPPSIFFTQRITKKGQVNTITG